MSEGLRSKISSERYLVLLCAPLLVCLISFLVLSLFEDESNPRDPCEVTGLSREQCLVAGSEPAVRVQAIGATILSQTTAKVGVIVAVIVALSTIFVAWSTAHAATDRKKAWRVLGLLVLGATVGAAIFVSACGADCRPGVHRGITLVMPALGLDLYRFEIAADLLITLAVGATASCAVAACLIAAEPADGHQQEVKELSQQMGRLKQVLYAGAAALVAAIVLMQAVGSWVAGLYVGTPTSIAGSSVAGGATASPPPPLTSSAPQASPPGPPQPSPGQFAARVFSAITLQWSAILTLLLISTYLPAAVFLRRRAERLAYAQPTNPRTWLNDNGFNVGWATEDVGKLIAMISPLLAGVTAEKVLDLINGLSR
jgi:hypothetical protein